MNLNNALRHVSLGKSDYGDVLALQRSLHLKRCRDEVDDLVLSVEHNSVFTIGRSGSRRNVLVPQEVLDQHGIQVHDVERGGDITYHGPGQLVIYPIVDLRGFGKDIHRFIESLEEAVIKTLSDLNIGSTRKDGYPGVWVGDRKIASVGVYVKNWVTYHGLALNVDVNQEHFRMIRPCGLSVETVSVNDVCATKTDVPAVGTILMGHLGSLLERDVVAINLDEVM